MSTVSKETTVVSSSTKSTRVVQSSSEMSYEFSGGSAEPVLFKPKKLFEAEVLCADELARVRDSLEEHMHMDVDDFFVASSLDQEHEERLHLLDNCVVAGVTADGTPILGGVAQKMTRGDSARAFHVTDSFARLQVVEQRGGVDDTPPTPPNSMLDLGIELSEPVALPADEDAGEFLVATSDDFREPTPTAQQEQHTRTTTAAESGIIHSVRSVHRVQVEPEPWDGTSAAAEEPDAPVTMPADDNGFVMPGASVDEPAGTSGQRDEVLVASSSMDEGEQEQHTRTTTVEQQGMAVVQRNQQQAVMVYSAGARKRSMKQFLPADWSGEHEEQPPPEAEPAAETEMVMADDTPVGVGGPSTSERPVASSSDAPAQQQLVQPQAVVAAVPVAVPPCEPRERIWTQCIGGYVPVITGVTADGTLMCAGLAAGGVERAAAAAPLAPLTLSELHERLKEIEAGGEVSHLVADAMAQHATATGMQVRTSMVHTKQIKTSVAEFEMPMVDGAPLSAEVVLEQQAAIARHLAEATKAADPLATSQQRESVEEGYIDEQGNVVVSKKVTRVVTTTKTTYEEVGGEPTVETVQTVESTGAGDEAKDKDAAVRVGPDGQPMIRLKVNQSVYKGTVDPGQHIQLQQVAQQQGGSGGGDAAPAATK